jgi:chromosome segregation ATPase
MQEIKEESMKTIAEKIEDCIKQIRVVKKRLDESKEDYDFIQEEEHIEDAIKQIDDKRVYYETQIDDLNRRIENLEPQKQNYIRQIEDLKRKSEGIEAKRKNFLYQINTTNRRILNLEPKKLKLQQRIDELEKKRENELPKKYQNENLLDKLLTQLQALKDLQAEIKSGEPSEEFKLKYPDWQSWYL